MWNFGVPYPLKHYIDVVTLPGQNWCWTRSGGYLPLLRDKRAILVYTSANNYCSDRVGQGVQLELQKPFMRKWLGFIGRSEEHTSELQSLMRISYAVFCLKKQKKTIRATTK